jgi:hypothetical protein
MVGIDGDQRLKLAGKSNSSFARNNRLLELSFIKLFGPVMVPHFDFSGLGRRNQTLIHYYSHEKANGNVKKAMGSVHFQSLSVFFLSVPP